MFLLGIVTSSNFPKQLNLLTSVATTRFRQNSQVLLLLADYSELFLKCTELSHLFSGHQLNSNDWTSWPLMFEWHIARELQRGLMDKWHLWGNYTKAHSVWLSLVAQSCWEQLFSLNESTGAVLGIMRQLVLLVPHITGIFITFASYPTSLALCRNSCSDSNNFKKTHCWGQMSCSPHSPPHPQSHLDKACRADQHWHLWFFFFWFADEYARCFLSF